MDRRRFLQGAAVGGAGIALTGGWIAFRPDDADGGSSASPSTGPPPGATIPAEPGAGYGPLWAPDANGIALPAGFRSRVVATSGDEVAGTGHRWHRDPDGGATFPTPSGGWIYVSNCESSREGGTGAIEFASDGSIIAARRILEGTRQNCAGGATPWGTWLSCEEVDRGRVWECDPTGREPAVARPALGRFQHEAAVVAPAAQVIYLTEDEPDGGLYRFVPDAYPDLDVPDPQATDTPTRHQVESHAFDGGEGAYFHGGLWFTTKGDGRVWRIDSDEGVLAVAYDHAMAEQNALDGVDNITVADRSGEVFVAEDGGNMEICVLVDGGGAVPFLRVEGPEDSELTGPAFSPDGTRLYFSSQRDPGRTYEVSGPFRSSD